MRKLINNSNSALLQRAKLQDRRVRNQFSLMVVNPVIRIGSTWEEGWGLAQWYKPLPGKYEVMRLIPSTPSKIMEE